jgi:hypothetical protein
VAQLSEWLNIMLGEISRKQAELEQARREEELRREEAAAGVIAPEASAGETTVDEATRHDQAGIRRRA